MSKSNFSPEKIEQWKKQYGDVYAYEVDGNVAYLRKADRKTIAAAQSIAGSDAIRYNEILLENCWLGGDEIIKTDDAYFLGISSFLAELIQIKVGELKKL